VSNFRHWIDPPGPIPVYSKKKDGKQSLQGSDASLQLKTKW